MHERQNIIQFTMIDSASGQFEVKAGASLDSLHPRITNHPDTANKYLGENDPQE